MKRQDLTPKQQAVLSAKAPVILVTGGPGSGKTATALWAGREAILTQEIAEDQYVLYLTFSRTSVSQITRRAPNVLADARGRIEVMTFHGLAFRLIRAFGRYSGAGTQVPRIQSAATEKLFGIQKGMVRYDDMVPAAIELLDREWIGRLVNRRWPLVICDEFQDTGDEQWRLVRRLAEKGRLLLLADPDQMIHDWRPDVRPERLKEARQLAKVTIALEDQSHRDKSGTIPSLAKAVLNRQFADQAVTTAIKKGVLRVVKDVDGRQLAQSVADEVRELRRSGCATVGVFGFTNDGSAALAAQLTELGLGNTIVGIPESHGEGLTAIGVLVAHGVGEATLMDVRIALATFLTAVTRGNAPPLALTLIAGTDLPAQLDQLLRELSARLTDAANGTMGDVLHVARDAWSSIITGGGSNRLWIRAFGSFAAFADGVVSAPASGDAARTLLERAEHSRAASLASDLDETRGVPVQVMNFHQTKGREADGVVLVFRQRDIYAGWREDREPYARPSRLLYVAISRARHKVTVILPASPHPLVSPFRGFAD